jgi:hypothetical protein
MQTAVVGQSERTVKMQMQKASSAEQLIQIITHCVVICNCYYQHLIVCQTVFRFGAVLKIKD